MTERRADQPGSVVVAGCGYVGSALATRLAEAGHTVFAVSRNPPVLPESVTPLRADLTDPASLTALPGRPELLVFSAAPGSRDEAVYRATYREGLRNVLAVVRPRRAIFVSSTVVYEQADGGWVDETTPTSPRGPRGRVQCGAEALLADQVEQGLVVRFGGIYGPGRTRLVEAVRSGRARWSAGRYTNRIHRDDCVGVLAHLAALEAPERLYLGVDDDPAVQREVYRWLAERLGVPEPAQAAEPASGANKRCRNARLHASGYRFVYPSFREGYAPLVGGRDRCDG